MFSGIFNLGWSAGFLFILIITFSGCGSGSGGDTSDTVAGLTLVVNSLEDTATPPAGAVTLRSAVESASSGDTITFAPSLDGKTITLVLVASEHSVLKGEMYNPDQSYAGYVERDYGRSALYARKDVTIDASSLPNGITISWGGGDSDRARVIAVYGNLILRNLKISNGYSSAAAIAGGTQPYTLARGGAVAVWGTATLEKCTLSGNRVLGDSNPSRDRGAFGGAIYGDRIILSDCVVSGNTATGYGAAGGAIYSVGGHEAYGASSISRCAITGNRVTAQHAYGGGVFSEGGGRGGSKGISIENCTIARNLVEDHPAIDQAPSGYYYRGGGVYMSNGSLAVMNCTIAENAVTGNPWTFNGKPNMGGGGLAATIGDAHVVEKMEIGHSIIAGNTVQGAADDVYTGSLINFYSFGYNLVGVIDFSQILVPVPPWNWWSLSRKHWPKAGDHDGLALADLVKLDSAELHGSIVSRGVDDGESALMWYPPEVNAMDRIPTESYTVSSILAQYTRTGGSDSDFLHRVLDKVKTDYSLGDTFGAALVCDVPDFVPQGVTWPRVAQNAGWIQFWRDLDAALGNSIGTAKLEDNFWGSFDSGAFGPFVTMEIMTQSRVVTPLAKDQRGAGRPAAGKGDIGAIEAAAE